MAEDVVERQSNYWIYRNMCGIVGIWAPAASELIGRMLNLISHRGPDGRGQIVFPDVGLALGHARLSIIDLSPLGSQPMSFQQRRLHIVFNGEIYNFRELRSELAAQGFTFKGHSDTEVLLTMFVRYGHDMLSKLNGIFALAIYDEQTGELFLARDQLGVKPLYYSAEPGRFAFASEMKALLRTGIVAPTLDPDAVLAHLGYLWSPGSRTIVRQIQKLEPGHALIVKEGHVMRNWRYFDLSFPHEKLRVSVNDAAEMLAAATKTAVQRQMIADVPVGAFLSGGLDSSAVVAFAQAVAPQNKLQCFTIDVDDDDMAAEGFNRDLPYATRVAQHLGVELHTVRVGEEMLDRLPQMIYHLDEPTPDPAALNAWYISELARQQGITVLLSGAGGDDILTGYRRHYALQQERYWRWLPAHARSAMASVAGALPTALPLSRRIGKALQYAGLDDDARLISYFLWARPEMAMGLLHKDFAAGLSPAALMAPMLGSLAHLPPGTAPLDKMLYLECKHFLADHNLHYTDKMGMAAGIEVRVPLLDLDLVALAAQLPHHYKQNGRIGKWIFKKAMEPFLPRDVIYRPKTGFGVPLRRWLHGRLRSLVEEVLSPATIAKRGIFDGQAVGRMVQLDRANRIDASYTIFSLVCIELWCRQFIDGSFVTEGAV